MREGSLPPFGLNFSPRGLARRIFGKLSSRLRAKASRQRQNDGPVAAPKPVDLELKADAALDRHEKSHAALFERASRLTAKARRLEEAGTPSESVRNRAERARDEALAELAVLRDSFVEASGEDASGPFERRSRERYPDLGELGI